jgi:hypothetical protein
MSFEVERGLSCKLFVNIFEAIRVAHLFCFRGLCLWIVHCRLHLSFSFAFISMDPTKQTRLEQTK